MLRFFLLAASLLSAAPAYWTQKSVGSNPVAPFTLARTDTIIARQIHDTADTLRKYTRDRIHDSMIAERAFDTVTARAIVKDTAIKLRTQIHDTADSVRAYARARIHDTADVLRSSIATKPVKHRFSISSTTGVPPLTMSYDNATRILSLTPTGSSFSWWWYGLEHIQSSILNLPAHSATTGLYFASFDSVGSVNISTAPFDLLRSVPIALFERNSALGQTWVYPELHTTEITPLEHAAQHTTIGTLLVQGGAAISGYTLNSDLPASVTYGIGSATIWDEDAKHSIAALSDGGPYQVRHRTAPGVWSWTSGLSLPYRVGTTYITADVGGVQTELNGAGLGQFVNYFVVLVPCLNGPQTVIVQGQAIHATEASAEAETWGSLDKTGLPYVEFVPVWQITYKAQVAYTGVSGRVQMVRAAQINTGGASAGAPSVTLQAAYNASPTPQIVTGASAGSVTVRRGSTNDTDAVIAVQNGAGTTTAMLNGNGRVLASSVLVAGATDSPLIKATTTSASTNSVGVKGVATVGNGVQGTATGGAGVGVLGTASGTGGTGVFAIGTGTSDALYALASGSGRAGYFSGSVQVTKDILWGGGILRDMVGATSYTALYPSGVTPTNSPHNYGLAVRKDGTESWLNSTNYVELAIGGTSVVDVQAGAVKIAPLAGTGTRMVTTTENGTLGADKRRILWEDAGYTYQISSATSTVLPALLYPNRTIPANTWTPGMTLRFEYEGIKRSATNTVLFEFFIGPTGTWTTPYYIPASPAFPTGDIRFKTSVVIKCITTGTSGTFEYSLETTWGNAGSTTYLFSYATQSGYLDVINTTVDRTIDFIAYSAANSTVIGLHSKCSMLAP